MSLMKYLKLIAFGSLMFAAPAFAHEDGNVDSAEDNSGYWTMLYAYHEQLGMCDVYYGRIGEDERERTMFKHMKAFYGYNQSVNIIRNVGRLLNESMIAGVDTAKLSGKLNIACADINRELALYRAKWEMEQVASQ